LVSRSIFSLIFTSFILPILNTFSNEYNDKGYDLSKFTVHNPIGNNDNIIKERSFENYDIITDALNPVGFWGIRDIVILNHPSNQILCQYFIPP
jgi:hypothetical protein